MNAGSEGPSQLTSARALWFWAVGAVGLAVAAIALLPGLSEPLNTLLKLAWSFLLVFWLPGYCFTRALFPRGSLNDIERVLLSVAMSIVLVPVVVLLLDEASVSLRASSLAPSLIILSMMYAVVAVLTERLQANGGPQR